MDTMNFTIDLITIFDEFSENYAQQEKMATSGIVKILTNVSEYIRHPSIHPSTQSDTCNPNIYIYLFISPTWQSDIQNIIKLIKIIM
jgi:hypothetical protein